MHLLEEGEGEGDNRPASRSSILMDFQCRAISMIVLMALTVENSSKGDKKIHSEH